MTTVQSYVTSLAPSRIVAQMKDYIEPLFTPTASAAPPPAPAPTLPPRAAIVAEPEPPALNTAMVMALQPTMTGPLPEPAWLAPARAAEIGRVTHRLVARFTGRTWIKVRMDNGQVNRENVRAGAVRQWVTNGRFVVSVGNAGAVRFELNWRPLPPLGGKGEELADVVLPPDSSRPQQPLSLSPPPPRPGAEPAEGGTD
jgi:cytoskeleton protein RodZ